MRARLNSLIKRYGVATYFIFWAVYFFSFWSRAIGPDKQGNIIANHVNIWGDWAAHFTMGSSFAYRDLWLTDSPLLLGARFSYPFVSDWLSGLLAKLGVDFMTAFTVPSFLTSMLMVFALFYFFRTMFQSRAVAILGSLIFLLNGGLGWLYFGYDILNSVFPLETLANPPHEYTRIDELGIKWISVIDSMMIPQRAFALGFPLTLIALALVHKSVALPAKAVHLQRRWIVTAGVILGVMPLVHTHSFMAAGIILAFWMGMDVWLKRKTWKTALLPWLWLGGVSLALAIPLFWYFFANQVHGFIQWYPGWLAREFKLNWLDFWFRNWAFTPLLALIGWYVWLKKTGSLTKQKWVNVFVWLPFFGLFAMANLWLFQPFSWDNTKLIVWASVGFSGLAGYLFRTQFHSRLGKIIVVPLFLITIASGGIDAYRILRTHLHSFQMYTAEEVQLAEWVKQNTGTEAIWLTGNQHNHWLFNLTGRQAVMTYPGWLWTHGYHYLPTETDMQYLYQHPSDFTMARKYGIDYVVIGPEEEKSLKANPAEWASYYPEIKTTEYYSIFQIQ